MLLLDTAGIAPADRIEAVNNAANAAGLPSEVTDARDGGEVRIRVENWQLGSGMLFAHDSEGLKLARSNRNVRAAAPERVVLCLQTSSRAWFTQKDVEQVVPRGDLMLVDHRYPYEFGWFGPGHPVSYQVSLDVLGLPDTTVRRAAGKLPASPYFAIFRSHLSQVASVADDLTSTAYAADTAGDTTTDLLRALLITAADEGPIATAPEAEIIRVLDHARRHVEDRSLSPGQIARALNMSERHLYTLCRNANISLEQWIIARRLELARARLAAPVGKTRTIAAIAHSCGFTDPAHFSRRFRQTYGLTPRQWQLVARESPKRGGGDGREPTEDAGN
jgi:AraC-like DNA-binding protein